MIDTQPNMQRILADVRKRIDAIDCEIQAKLNERACLAEEVAELKKEHGLSGADGAYYRPAREAEVIRMAVARNKGPLSNDSMARLVREIMSACLALESPLTVAYLGPEGTYTQAAVYKHFGHFVTAKSVTAIDEIFRDVEAGVAAYGVVPVENSTEGVITHTLDNFVSSNLQICGEVSLPVHHYLLSQEQDLSKIKHIYAHAQALAQCRKWLDAKLPLIPRTAVASNAVGAQIARNSTDAGLAAIASKAAGEIYELDVLAANIEDDPNNTTRFLVIGKQSVPATGIDMTSLLLSAYNRPGALYELLAGFATAGINLTRIESRPSRRVNWDYNFFIDIEGHTDEPKVAALLQTMKQQSAFFKILGSYPRAVI